ncbi:MAG: ring-hydroxylating oxygenase subunit alpha [Roseibium sp.]|uniref:ring-hydroxylating oxygenase subunit alpha n=1 Tax=Roseibium sp. TaxID=1936156 RepID=UPI003D9C3F7B
MARRPDLGFFEGDIDLQKASTWQAASGPFEEARKIDPLIYRSLTFSLLENEAIWTRDWIFVGTTDDIPEAGDLLPYTIGNHGIHIQRMPDGSLEGRFNNAQHGGCRFVPLQCQQGSKTKCSFTSCGYSRDRGAISAAQGEASETLMYQYVGLRPERLLRISVARQDKLLFVNLNGPNERFEVAQLAGSDILQACRFSERIGATTKEYRCNWKTLANALFAHVESCCRDGLVSLSADIAVEDGTGVQEQVSATWFYPNLILLQAGNYVATLGLQPTALEKTLCRIQLFASGTMTSTNQRETAERLIEIVGTTAEAVQSKSTASSPLPMDDAETRENLSLQAHWAQSVLISRVLAMPEVEAHDPMFQPLKNYLI